MLQIDSESDEKEESDEDQPYTRGEDEVCRWELDDWIMDDKSEDRLYYQRCSETGMAFERVLGRKKSTVDTSNFVTLFAKKAFFLKILYG